jgi:hypothetical protein
LGLGLAASTCLVYDAGKVVYALRRQRDASSRRQLLSIDEEHSHERDPRGYTHTVGVLRDAGGVGQ